MEDVTVLVRALELGHAYIYTPLLHTDGWTDRRREYNARRLSVGLSRFAATSTRRDGGDRGGRCCRACLSVRPSLKWSLTQMATTQ